MANKMLIDSTHPEETRVVVVRGNRVEEFDFESAARKQLRGNIYLAKVTRVEPSLQACFVEYGGNRHGFLAFNEIHPDYYQIPVADRLALLEEEKRAARAEREAEDAKLRNDRKRRRRRRPDSAAVAARTVGVDAVVSEAPSPETAEPATAADAVPAVSDALPATESPATEAPEAVAEPTVEPVAAPSERRPAKSDEDEDEDEAEEDEEDEDDEEDDEEDEDDDDEEEDDEDDEDEDEEDDDEDDDEDEDGADKPAKAKVVEIVGSGEALEEMPERVARPLRRQYRIQEVIKRRQVLLVQVVKEERGTKGAALTTYLSLAGRYSVLMPNTARGGGISRKITSAADRKRLKSVAAELEVPEGMGVILRTAGANRTKTEIKRDFEYLLRLWETVRELTLQSSAPALVYEEGSLIKRAIRDLYNKDIDEVLVAGEDGYREAKEFMRMLMPSHAKNVQPYRETAPIFARSGVEPQLDAMFSPTVQLRSGGYIVINQTEALVAIDVNSGRSTREHSIEETALKTNLEASDEVARQLRLRDLAGLIVVDFIDMDEKRNNRAVERRLKEALKNDRARIQVGRISHFGLLEMSRQRIRTGVLESSSEICPHCGGTGHVRAPASVALHVLRAIEDLLIKSASHDLIVRTRTPVALYCLNQKRSHLFELERRFGVLIEIEADDSITGQIQHVIDKGALAKGPVVRAALAPIQPDAIAPEDEEIEEVEAEAEAEVEAEVEVEDTEAEATADNGRDANGRRRRRRRRRGRDDAQGDLPAESAGERDDAPRLAAPQPTGEDDDDDGEDGDEARDGAEAGDANSEERRRRRRRGRRGGRRGRRDREGLPGEDAEAGEGDDEVTLQPTPRLELIPPLVDSAEPATIEAAEPAPQAESHQAEPMPVEVPRVEAPEVEAPKVEVAPVTEPESQPRGEPVHQVLTPDDDNPNRPKRSGWWSRRVG
ncbi:Rne/Rng family ribonuclease [Blastochloris viridis]|uniref:Ribonuclease E n=1 Tax=Blastochloris viridis TaxID=1079 RepID=A0A0H5B6K1_BLAVI|nr:Rne/Rng family ribonuclease [Blastochloris viridis]ALK08897.1 Ribonuclease E [Blastochloris viridis]BAR97800.1 cytoplasmic axial filament protein CafA and Ribonuclease G [Blastochloris viridis]CUU41558.1 Ribonuclease E [Blastochloris viridis]